jgi:hypothetical protein
VWSGDNGMEKWMTEKRRRRTDEANWGKIEEMDG